MPGFWSSSLLPATWLGKSPLQNTILIAVNFPGETHLPSPPAGDVRPPSAEVGEAVRVKPSGFTSCLQQHEVLGVAAIGVPKASSWAAARVHLYPSPRLCPPHREVTACLPLALSMA